MEMSAKQLAAVKYLTNRLAYLIEGAEFTAEMMTDYKGRPTEVMVSASNVENTSWFEKSQFVLAFVGRRGGITVKNGSSFIRKMI